MLPARLVSVSMPSRECSSLWDRFSHVKVLQCTVAREYMQHFTGISPSLLLTPIFIDHSSHRSSLWARSGGHQVEKAGHDSTKMSAMESITSWFLYLNNRLLQRGTWLVTHCSWYCTIEAFSVTGPRLGSWPQGFWWAKVSFLFWGEGGITSTLLLSHTKSTHICNWVVWEIQSCQLSTGAEGARTAGSWGASIRIPSAKSDSQTT